MATFDSAVELANSGAKLPTDMHFFEMLVNSLAKGPESRSSIGIKLIKKLIADGFDVNGRNENKQSPLLYVISKRDKFLSPGQQATLLHVINILVEAGADLTEKTYPLNRNLLHISVSSDIILKKLLTYPITHTLLYEEDRDGRTPFMLACLINSIPAITEFLNIPGFNPFYETKAIKILDMVKYPSTMDLILTKSTVKPPPMYLIKRYSKNLNAKERAKAVKSSIQELREPIGKLLEIKKRQDMPIAFPTVDSIFIHPIGISELPTLPNSLQYLNVSGNPVNLPQLHEGLRSLLCAGCGIEELPELPDTLEYLDASNNKLKDINKLPPNLYISPIGKTNSSNDILYSTNLLLTGNPLPIGFFNGYGSITQYSKKHIANIIDHEGEAVYTTILPKGTILFRNSSYDYRQDEILGLYNKQQNKHILYPGFNVFFYPYPFVGDFIVETEKIHVFELERDVEVLMGVEPSPNTRADRENSTYMVSCDTIETGIHDTIGHDYDPCFSRSFSTAHPEISGMFVLAKEDTDLHIRNDLKGRFWSKYRTNFIDGRNAVGVAEIILHPHANRYDSKSPLNYKYYTSFNHTDYMYDEGCEKINEHLTNGKWTIDLFTKLYVNYESASDEVKARCVPPNEPYKLHYLNYNYWKTQGGKRRKTRKRKSKRTITRRK